MAKEEAFYSHGHHKSVLSSHSWRTAQNSMGFVLPHLKPTDFVLDVGCGPGTITVDLAKLVPKGRVLGIDPSNEVLEQGRQLARSQDVQNVSFESEDANALPYPDDTFDVVLAHQVLQHVKRPVDILKEMRRVVRPGGIVAARDSDYLTFTWYPELEGLSKWSALYQRVARTNGGEPNAGRYAHVWAKQAGFARDNIQCSSTSWVYSTKEEAEWWGGVWADRTLYSNYAKTVIGNELGTQEDLNEISQTWREWGSHPDAWFCVPSGEILCRKSATP